MVIDSYHKEIVRKVIHFFALGYLAIYFVVAVSFSHQTALLVLTGMLVVLIIMEYIRLQLHLDIPLLRSLYKFRRCREQNALGGELYFLLGVLVSLSVFEISIAVVAALMAVFGDMAAALMGRRYGRIRPSVFGGKKSIEGAVASLLVNMVVGFLFLYLCGLEKQGWHIFIQSATGLDGLLFWPVVVVMALTASVVELAVSKIDDNLTVPVTSGFTGQLALLAMAC